MLHLLSLGCAAAAHTAFASTARAGCEWRQCRFGCDSRGSYHRQYAALAIAAHGQPVAASLVMARIACGKKVDGLLPAVGHISQGPEFLNEALWQTSLLLAFVARRCLPCGVPAAGAKQSSTVTCNVFQPCLPCCRCFYARIPVCSAMYSCILACASVTTFMCVRYMHGLDCVSLLSF